MVVVFFGWLKVGRCVFVGSLNVGCGKWFWYIISTQLELHVFCMFTSNRWQLSWPLRAWLIDNYRWCFSWPFNFFLAKKNGFYNISHQVVSIHVSLSEHFQVPSLCQRKLLGETMDLKRIPMGRLENAESWVFFEHFDHAKNFESLLASKSAPTRQCWGVNSFIHRSRFVGFLF